MTDEMHAMVLTAPGAPLRLEPREDPVSEPGDVRAKIGACGVCRTECSFRPAGDGKHLGIFGFGAAEP